ncbi:MAG: tocopherol cyclase family protein [Clostridium sp.]|uniref:tocopherol cyclase family protein n=1 Tax=Clostridium sp. TaxID=1506 RepID=UPI001EBA0296|nr:tocopherol cyclase family protein [Clostridium sp.]MBS5886608.1 hypothetical protein [Clostridium sp.]MDU7149505.1 tocopherol cyclase family protein [Clostridium sp.]
MKNKNSYSNKKSFFEGWYFKQQFGDDSIAFIPGINIDKNGLRYAFIQVITNKESYNIKYDFKDFSISYDKLTIKIRDNIFSKKGLILNIVSSDIKIKGKLSYDNITTIKSDIMGPFALFPFMECSHGIISLHHIVNGNLNINNEEIIIKDGIGYIEKDSGKSFPKSYLWIQCNSFKNTKANIMVSIADIPFLGFEFKGCIASILYKEKEYRLATYNGVKIINYNENGLIIKRGKYKLEIEINENYPQKLLAPDGGKMIRTIYENISCRARFKFYKKDKLIFNLESEKASFEYVK